jgi:hypothetical protein
VLVLGCGADRDAFLLGVHATLDGQPVRGVEISEGGVRLGETGPDGTLRLAADRPEGTRLELAARCPAGHRARPATMQARLRRLSPLEGRSAPPLMLEMRCERRVRDVVVVVDAGHAGLDVLVDGRVVDHTNEVGLAHLWLEQPPGQRFVVSLDTSGHPELVPPSPEQRFTVSSRDEVFYWARPLSDDDEDDGRGVRRAGRRGRGGRSSSGGEGASIERMR